MKKLQVGLIGYGFSGSTFHAPFLKELEGFEIRKVLSSDKEKVQKELGSINVVSKIESVLKDPIIDLVVITTPNSLHFEMAKNCLLHHKHVILEKPMVTDVSEAEELIQLANKRQLMLSVYQNRRWDNDFLTVQHLIKTGVLGEINTYKAHFDRFRPQVRDRWRERATKEAGVLFDLGAHLVDQALCLFGMPKWVMGDVVGQRTGALSDDYFHVLMGYEKLRVILHTGSIVKASGPKFEVHGSKGSFMKYGMDGQEAALIARKSIFTRDWGKDNPEYYGELTIDEEGQEVVKKVETIPGSYTSYYRQVYAHLCEGKPCPVTGEEGIQTIRILEAARKSSKEKQAVFFDNRNES